MGLLLFLNVGCVSFLFFCLLEAACFLNFWFVLEVLSLCVAPYFVLCSVGFKYRGLLSYMVVLMLSSFFLVAGAFVVSWQSLLLSVGVLLKLGVFPFMAWAYDVLVFSNWVVVWFVSGLLKIPFLLLFYVCEGCVEGLLCVLCVGSLCVLSVSLWKFSWGWCYVWCHMMLSGSAGLVIISVSCPFYVNAYVYFVYFVWCSLVILFLSLKEGLVMGWGVLSYLFLLISFPFSVAVLYKLSFGVSLLFGSFFVFCFWCFYTISEQLFLVNSLVGHSKVRSFVSLFMGV